MCLNANCVCLLEDASVGYPILPVDTEDTSEYALLELFEHFHMATVGDPRLTTGGENNSFVDQYLGCCSETSF